MNAVEKLNTGKSADENGIHAEHFHECCEFARCFFGEASLWWILGFLQLFFKSIFYY
jgi:hypothetical protein